MVVLVTGANGFVGRYLCKELADGGHNVVTTDVCGVVDVTADLLNEEAVHELMVSIRPDAIIHLAGQASVTLSWEKPKWTETLNVHTTLNLLNAISGAIHPVRLLVIGSSDQYGLIQGESFMVTEQTPCRPINPYAISKYTQEQLALTLACAKKLDVLCTRSFNHIGPGQSKGFVVSDFSSCIVAIERGADPVMCVGNLEVYRDFTDVRDVVHAYRLLLENGHTREIYNIGSGIPVAISQLLSMLIEMSTMTILVKQDPTKMRAIDMLRVGCNHDKLTADTGWVPQIPLRESLYDTLDWWRKQ